MASVNDLNPEGEADLSDVENGVLTAYEAMNLNFTGTSLVILSACETGLGEVKSGEGVYGLQRAFLVAGAETLIMSLWKVDDEATQQLMTNFYTNWIASGNKQAAFKQAQLQLMTKFPEPYFWGAFVMVRN
jgi:CHAT domain-containing protein